jgi:ketosteroid isomerase-like protein
MYQYARCADNRDYAGFADVFCEDAVFDFSGNLVTSLPAIQEMMHALDKYSSTLHQVSNTLYEVEGDIATGETYCIACHLYEESGAIKKLDMGIIYQDRLRRTATGWRIVQRVFRLLWTRTIVVDQ